MRRRAIVALGAAALAFAAARPAHGAGQPVGLPSPASPVTASPPLPARPTLLGETRVPGPLSSRQQVLVGVDEQGKPVEARVVQRLTLVAKGDYSFVVPAPVVDVEPAAGSDSAPGLRRDAIVWQGFSPGRRELGADATLRLRVAAANLPIRVAVRTLVGGRLLGPRERRSGPLELELTVENATTANAPSFIAEGVPSELAGLLDGLRRTVQRGDLFGAYAATITTEAKPRSYRIDAPFVIRGTLRFRRGAVAALLADTGAVHGDAVTFSARLGDGSPLRLVLRVRGTAHAVSTPELTLVARPARGPRSLSPPVGGTWRRALARGLVPADGKALLATTIETIFRLSRLRQYGAFILDPGSYPRAGSDRTVYVYRTAPPRAAAAAPLQKHGGDVLVPVVAAVASVLAAGALVVLWAHS
jgi:hypothetical protein